jgi:hypothetical protein
LDAVARDDQGWIMKSPQENTIITTSKISSDLKYFDENNYGQSKFPSYFYHLNFYSSKNYNKIERSFMKIQDFAAIMGGFIKMVTLFLGFFNSSVNKHQLEEAIFNNFFEYNQEKIDKKSIALKNSSIELFMINNLSANRKIKGKNNSHLDNSIVNLKKITNPLQNDNNKLNTSKVNNENNILGNAQLSQINSINQVNLSNDLKIKNHAQKKLSFKYIYALKIIVFSNSKNENFNLYKLLGKFFLEKFDVIHYLHTLNVVETLNFFF